jgi:hypothetical protein
MPLWSLLTGDKLDYAKPEERHAQRLARMRKNVWLGVSMLRDHQVTAGGALVMYTLTYASIKDWAPRHISGCMRWLRAQGVRLYVWVAELQRRGAVHYHVLALLPDGQRWVKPNTAHGGWTKGFTWVSPDIVKPFYIMKYLQKGQGHNADKDFPKGLRLYGVSSSAIRGAAFQDALAWRQSHLPTWASCDTKDPCITLGSRRVRGGVSYGDKIECSPYTIHALPDIERVAWQMRHMVLSSTHIVQE